MPKLYIYTHIIIYYLYCLLFQYMQWTHDTHACHACHAGLCALTTQAELRQREWVRNETDTAYEASLRADREKTRLRAQERERDEAAQRDAAKAKALQASAEKEHMASLERLAGTLPGEPGPGYKGDVATLGFTFPDGVSCFVAPCVSWMYCLWHAA